MEELGGDLAKKCNTDYAFPPPNKYVGAEKCYYRLPVFNPIVIFRSHQFSFMQQRMKMLLRIAAQTN